MQRAPDTRRQRNTRRLVFVVVASLAAVGSLLTRPPEPASATAVDESAFVVALNRVRADHGLTPFAVNAELTALARGHAQLMADAGEIFHANPISEGYNGPWAKLGENVGVGADVDVLMDAFVASPGHFANIVDPSFSHVGVGVVWVDTALYTTHRFLQLPGAPTTTVPATSAPPTTTPPTTVPTTTQRPIAPPATLGTVPALPAPAIQADRVRVLLELAERVGT